MERNERKIIFTEQNMILPEYGKVGCFYQHFIQEINHLGVENNLVDESCQFPVVFEVQPWAIWRGISLKSEPIQADASEVKCCAFLWRLLIVGRKMNTSQKYGIHYQNHKSIKKLSKTNTSNNSVTLQKSPITKGGMSKKK